MKNLKIEKIDFQELAGFINKAKKERVSFTNNNNCFWYCIRYENVIKSFYCLQITGVTARFKSNYTVPDFRCNGCLQKFINHAIIKCKERKVKKMTAFCTPLSIQSHIRNGAKVKSSKGDIKFVEYLI